MGFLFNLLLHQLLSPVKSQDPLLYFPTVNMVPRCQVKFEQNFKVYKNPLRAESKSLHIQQNCKVKGLAQDAYQQSIDKSIKSYRNNTILLANSQEWILATEGINFSHPRKGSKDAEWCQDLNLLAVLYDQTIVLKKGFIFSQQIKISRSYDSIECSQHFIALFQSELGHGLLINRLNNVSLQADFCGYMAGKAEFVFQYSDGVMKTICVFNNKKIRYLSKQKQSNDSEWVSYIRYVVFAVIVVILLWIYWGKKGRREEKQGREERLTKREEDYVKRVMRNSER